MRPETDLRPLPLHNPIRFSEWALALSGVAILVGLGLEWANGSSGYDSITLLKVLILVLALVSIPIPLMLWATIKSDVPIIWETLLLTFSAVMTVVLVAKVLLVLGGGLGPGFWVVFAACLLNSVSAWYAVSREH